MIAYLAAWALYAVAGPQPTVLGSMTSWVWVASFVGAWIAAVTLIRLRFYAAPSAEMAWRTSATVEIDDRELSIQEGRSVRRFALDDIAEGWTESIGGEEDVVLRTRADDLIAVRVPTQAHGRKLLFAAGVAVEQHFMRMRLAEASVASATVGCVCATAGILLPITLLITGIVFGLSAHHALESGRALSDAGYLSGVVFAAAVYGSYKLLQAMTPPLATVGVDGVEIRELGRRRFIPLDGVAGVGVTTLGVTLTMKDGAEIVLTTLRHRGHDDLRVEVATREALARRIRGALAARKASDAGVTRVDTLERKGRTFESWREELTALGRDHAGYRRAGLGRDDLGRVLDDLAAPAEHRIAAAMALSSSDDEATRRRVRVAAAACADPDLRAALEAAAEAELEEALVERVVGRQVT